MHFVTIIVMNEILKTISIPYQRFLVQGIFFSYFEFVKVKKKYFGKCDEKFKISLL